MNSLILLIALASSGSQAQDHALGYADALRRALANNPTLAQAQATVSSAEGGLVSAQGSFDPTLSLRGSARSDISEGFSQFGQVASETNSVEWGASLSQYLPTGTSLGLDLSLSSQRYRYELLETGNTFELEDPQRYSTLALSLSQSLLEGHRMAYNLSAVREAQRALTRAEATAMATQLSVVAQTAAAYWTLCYQRDLQDIAQQALEVAVEEERVVRAMVEAGQLAPVEATRVEAAVVQARTTLIETQHAHRAASEALALLMGEDPGEFLRADSLPEPPKSLSLDDEQVVQAALAGNPELAVARSNVDSAQIALSNARHARLPELALTGGVGISGYDPTMAGSFTEMFAGDLRYWSLGGEFSVPLLNRADRGSYTQYAAALHQAEQELEAQSRSVSSQVRAQLRTVEAGLQKVDLAEANLKLAEATAQAEKARQREGRAIQKDLLEAQRAVRDAQASLALARTEYAVAVVELGRLQGRIEGVGR